MGTATWPGRAWRGAAGTVLALALSWRIWHPRKFGRAAAEPVPSG